MTDEQPTTRRAAREAERQARGRTPRGAAPSAPPASAASADAGDGTPSGEPASGGARSGGFLAAIRKHPTAWLVSAGAVVFLLLGTGAIFAGVAVASNAAPVPTATATPEPPRPVPDAELLASRLRTCSVAPLAADPRLMSFAGQVVRADTGEVLFDRGGTTPARTASVLKVLTAAAALEVLGPDFQISTHVVAGSTPGTIVLVGRGDATLSALPPGVESVYRGAPKLADLAQQVLARYSGEEITSIVLDASYWSPADKWDPSWARSEQTIGYHSEVTALQVDGDRADPTRNTSPRSTDPITRAGQAFLQALRDADTEGVVADEVSLTTGVAVSGTTLLGEVRSQPVRTLIDFMLKTSDNTLAEMLGRIVSKESGLDGSAASLQQAIPSAVHASVEGTPPMTIIDGSGLSEYNAVAPATVNALLRAIDRGDRNLAIVREALPVAGQTGSLASRFGGANAVARGNVRAKTGWIDTAYTLAGIITPADGVPLIFSFYAIGEGIGENAKEALDTLTTGVFTCGDNLSNN